MVLALQVNTQDTTTIMSSSSMLFPTQAGLATMMAAALITIFAVALSLYILLVQIELQSTLTFGSTVLDDVALEENDNPKTQSPVTMSTSRIHHDDDDDNEEKKQDDSNGRSTLESPQSTDEQQTQQEDETVVRRLHLPMFRRISLAAIVGFVTFMTYLLLVRSNANLLLRWLGMMLMLVLLMRPTITEEVRRERMDRLAAIFSMVLMLCMALNLAVYASQQHAQGDVYQGPARIVGYDSTSYTQEKDDTIYRTDVQVAWGGAWGCPNVPDQACEAFVSGALCEMELEDDDNRQLTILKRLEEDVDEAEEREYEYQEGDDGQDPEQKNADLYEENKELQQENEELKEKNEELQEGLELYEDYASEEEEELAGYSFDDDNYSNGYWTDVSWEDVWGEYSCSDLFDSDTEGESFDNAQPPGSDQWPFINVYGNCNTCEAYVVDYYSIEHYQSILNYKTAALYYGIAAGLSLLVTAYLFVKEMKNPRTLSAEKEIELLPTIHGALA